MYWRKPMPSPQSNTLATRQKPRVQNCGSCRYYRAFEREPDDDDEEEGPTGVCRRYPPLTLMSMPPISVFPEVSTEEWCGEYMPREDE